MILLTGAAGFLGQHLLDRFRADGRAVCPTAQSARILECKEGFRCLDMEDPRSFGNLPERIDTVIHLAALVPQKNKVFSFEKYMAVNAVNMGRLVESLSGRGCRKFIYASTQMVIGEPLYQPIDENHPVVPISDYGFSKAAGERSFFSCAASLGREVLSLRFPGIYGPGERPGYVLTNFIEAARQHKPLHVFGGEGKRNLLYVKDAVDAILAAMEARGSDIFNIGTGRSVTIKEMAETIADVFSGGASRVLVSERENAPISSDFCFDITKAKKELGFSARFELKKGLMDYKLTLGGCS